VTSGLLQTLSRAIGTDEFVTALERSAREFPEYRAQLPTIPYAYTRTRLIDAPHFEVVAMLWSPGSVSPIHDHGLSQCWVLMMEGALEVDNFEREGDPADTPVLLRETGRLTLTPGDLDHRLVPREMHRVSNKSKEPAYSLQLYAHPISEYRIVDEHTLTSRLVSAVTDLQLLLD